MPQFVVQLQGGDLRLAEEMPVPADTGTPGHGNREPGTHPLGAQGHGVLFGE